MKKNNVSEMYNKAHNIRIPSPLIARKELRALSEPKRQAFEHEPIAIKPMDKNIGRPIISTE